MWSNIDVENMDMECKKFAKVTCATFVCSCLPYPGRARVRQNDASVARLPRFGDLCQELVNTRSYAGRTGSSGQHTVWAGTLWGVLNAQLCAAGTQLGLDLTCFVIRHLSPTGGFQLTGSDDFSLLTGGPTDWK